jgi:signal transduction histidine kinase
MDFIGQKLPVRLLLIEDSPQEAARLCELLGDPAQPCVVEQVESPSEARQRLARDRFDAILVDLDLPDSQAKDTILSVKSAGPLVPIIALIGSDDEQIASGALRAGAHDYVVKGQFDGRLLYRFIRYASQYCQQELVRRELESQMISAIANEQRRIGRELHDGVGQGLSALNLMAKSLHRKLRNRRLSEAHTAEMMTHAIRDLLADFRKIVHGLAPIPAGAQGLRIELERLCERIQEQTGVSCRCDCDPAAAFHNHAMANHFYRIAQEAINNALRHARAGSIAVRLFRENDLLTLTVADDGVGFEPANSIRSGLGIQIMEHRSRLLGASYSIQSAVGKGSTVRCSYRYSSQCQTESCTTD